MNREDERKNTSSQETFFHNKIIPWFPETYTPILLTGLSVLRYAKCVKGPLLYRVQTRDANQSFCVTLGKKAKKHFESVEKVTHIDEVCVPQPQLLIRRAYMAVIEVTLELQ